MLKKVITPKLSINTTNIKKFCYSSEKTYVLILTTFIFFIILGLGKVMHGKIVILAICCYVLCKLISLCKSKLYGGMFLIFSIIICNIPAFLIQISSKREAFNHMPDYLKQSLYFFGTVTLTFIGANVLSTIANRCKHAWSKQVFKICIALLLLSPLIVPTCYIPNWVMDNPPLDCDAIIIFFQTNFSEAGEYFTTKFNLIKLMVCIISGIFVIIVVSKNVQYSFVKPYGTKYYTLLILSLILSLYITIRYHHNIVTHPFYNAHTIIQEFAPLRELTKESAQRTRKLPLINNSTFKGTYVVVIGESTNRNYMSAYGYKSETTPWQKELQNQDNAILLQQAFSSHTLTVKTITYALTQKNQYQNAMLDWSKTLTFIDLARYSAGFNTIWISNQTKHGISDTPISILADSTNFQFWLNNNRKNYDEVVLHQLNSLNLQGNNNIIFIHLMGAHFTYSDRYPKKFNLFSDDSEEVNSYKNALLYNDNILHHIYNLAQKLPNFQAMLYISDHGEDVGTKLYHNPSTYTPNMTKIPFWILFSPDYINRHPQIISTLKSHKNIPFTNDMLFETMLGLMGITSVDAYIKENDLTSPYYNHSFYDLRTLYGKKELTP